MTGSFKAYTKTHPRLYDALAAVSSWLPLKKDDAYQFFDGFSRAHGRRVTFVQIGASDGLRWDPLRLFVVRDGWNGILVEPLPSAFEILRSNYRHVKRSKLLFVNAAISCVDGEFLSFWTLDESFLNGLSIDERVICSQKSSFDKEHLVRWARLNGYPETVLKQIKVLCFTVDELIRRYWDGRPVNLLVIDAEGHEADILGSMDFRAVKPEAIFFESHNLGARKTAVHRMLVEMGYDTVEMGGDSVALQQSANLIHVLGLEQ